MKFESASGMSNDALEALAEKLYGTQDKLEEHVPADNDLDQIIDDLYEGQFAALCINCGFWHDPILLDPNDICDQCLGEMEDDMEDDDYDDDDFDLPFGFSEVDLDDEDDIDEEEWDDADIDGIDDFDWEDDEDDD